MKTQNHELLIIGIIKSSVMIRFDIFFWRNYLQKILMQILEFLKSFEKTKLVEGEEIIDEDRENTENLNTFFSNAVKNLKISEY